MKALIFAMEKEAATLLKTVKITNQYNDGFTKIYECVYENTPFLLAISGVGKAFAAAGIAALAHHKDKIDCILNFGVAGTLNGDIAPIGSAVIGNEYVEHDMDTSAVGDPVGFISGINIVKIPHSVECARMVAYACEEAGVSHEEGLIASGDIFFRHDDSRKKEVIERWNPLCIDMESAPYAQLAYVYHIPFASVRLISDWKNPSEEYFANLPNCIEKIKDICLKVLLS